MKPTVLIATTSRWFPTARLGMALARVGCTIDIVCPSRHPIRVTHAVRQTLIYSGLSPLTSFAAAISTSKPDLIIPSDDIAVAHLHELYYREQQRGKLGETICALIERSLGLSDNFPIVRSRTRFAELAKKEGIRVPDTETVANLEELGDYIARMGFPVVLKSDGTSGGEGVRIVWTADEAERAFRVLQAPPLLARAAKRALIDLDTRLIWPCLLRTRSVVNAQTFVAGCEATSTIACWGGRVVANLHFEVLSKHDSRGPSTVLRFIDNPDMSLATERIARRLNLSGIYGFDFMLEVQTGKAHLIEINPRATQVGHLALGPGRDLPAALHAAITGRTVQDSAPITEKDTITLFPHEWLRDPKSPFLQSSYHDVPWEEPEFVRLCVGTRRKRDSLYSQRRWTPGLSPTRLPH